MESFDIMGFLKESIFTVTVFSVFLVYAMVKGRYAIINAIFALYLALLISVEFPYYRDLMQEGESGAVLKISIFIGFVIVGIMLFRRHIPGDDFESAFQGLWKKILLATMATILVMAFSFHALPVTEVLTPSSPIQELFAPKENFFWWLLIPLITLFFV